MFNGQRIFEIFEALLCQRREFIKFLLLVGNYFPSEDEKYFWEIISYPSRDVVANKVDYPKRGKHLDRLAM